MSQLKEKLLQLTDLRYEMLPLLLDNMKVDERTLPRAGDSVALVLKCHLLSEVVLDKLLTFVLEPNGEAVLAVRLSYTQKLNVASRCVLAEDWKLLPDSVVGSLRRLNRIRNRLAHELGVTVTREEAVALYEGLDNPMPLNHETAEVSMLLYHYTPCIFGNMLPKFEPVEDDA